MRRSHRIGLAACATLLLFSDLAAAQGSWTQILSIGQSVGTIVRDPNDAAVLYAGSGLGVSKTTDGGKTWSFVNTGIAVGQVGIASLAIDPSDSATVFAGYACNFSTSCGGVYKTTDAGVQWVDVSTGLIPASIVSLAIDPLSPTTIYAGSNRASTYGEVAKSVDGGESWTTVLATGPVLALAVDPFDSSTVYAGVETFEATPNALLKTADGGVSWSTAFDAAVDAIAVDNQNSGTVYIATQTDVFRTDDRGTSWKPLGVGSALALILDSTNPLALFAGGSLGFAESLDGGATWTFLTSGFPPNVVPSSLAVTPGGSAVYAATDVGVFVLGTIPTPTPSCASFVALPDLSVTHGLVTVVTSGTPCDLHISLTNTKNFWTNFTVSIAGGLTLTPVGGSANLYAALGVLPPSGFLKIPSTTGDVEFILQATGPGSISFLVNPTWDSGPVAGTLNMLQAILNVTPLSSAPTVFADAYEKTAQALADMPHLQAAIIDTFSGRPDITGAMSELRSFFESDAETARFNALIRGLYGVELTIAKSLLRAPGQIINALVSIFGEMRAAFFEYSSGVLTLTIR
jgi:photosystem II stability/assembly factor-like uncharacterized protein